MHCCHHQRQSQACRTLPSWPHCFTWHRAPRPTSSDVMQDRIAPQPGPYDVSRLLERYFTPTSSAQAKAAVQRTLRHTTDKRPSSSSNRSSFTLSAAAGVPCHTLVTC